MLMWVVFELEEWGIWFNFFVGEEGIEIEEDIEIEIDVDEEEEDDEDDEFEECLERLENWLWWFEWKFNCMIDCN